MKIPPVNRILGFLFLLFATSVGTRAQTPQWDRWETTVPNTHAYSDPYRDVTLNVTFTKPSGATVTFWGFYDGGTTWKLRYMPDQTGTWSYTATFNDGQPGKSGTFVCSASNNPGMLKAYAGNPRWFGFSNGDPVLIRSLHVPGLFKFVIDDPDNAADGNERGPFLDWAATQGYNLFSTMFFSTRNPANSGVSTDSSGPKLWPLDAASFRKCETILNDLSDRRMMVYCFTGFFGNSSPQPTAAADRTLYIRYCLARFGPYWNVLHSVGGPEVRDVLSDSTINSLGNEISAADPFGHPLGAHQRDGDDVFRTQPWCGYVTLQHEITNLSTLNSYFLNNYVSGKPVYAQETLWMGNVLQPAWTLTDLRKHMWVHMMSAVSYNAGDQNGKNDSGFGASMVLGERIQARHDIPKKIWDFMESIPFHRMSPRQDLRSNGFMLAEVGAQYLCYLPTGGSTNITVGSGTYNVTWVNAQNPMGDQRAAGTTTTGTGLAAPDGNDWLVYLTLSGGGTPQAPSITTQPQNQTVTAGQTATFTVTASGTPAPTYQWQKNTVAISGATSSSYTTPTTTTADNGSSYRVVVTNSSGTVTSNAATLTVNAASGGDVPAPWSSDDIGSVGIPGDADHDSGVFTIDGSGADINGTADAFHFVHQIISGDCDLVARVTSQTNTDSWAKAGVMIRESLDANAKRLLMVVTPGNGFRFQYRATTGGTTPTSTGGGSLNAAPNNWVRLVRAGDVFTAYKSADGSNWTQVATQTIPMSTAIYVGLAVCAHTNSTLATATFDNVSVSGSSAGGLPSPWAADDLGPVGISGSADYAAGVFTVEGSGVDINGTADSFHFVRQPASGDCDIRVRVSSQTNTNTWAKAGVMIRESLQPGSRHAIMVVTPGNGFRFQYRATTDATTPSSAYGGSLNSSPNNWVRLTRTGNTFTGYKSIDGVNWTQVYSTTIAMGSGTYIGLPVCSHDNTALSTVTFDNVSVVQ
jgi:regulation of enolase protein 1 (concanavalin A-like superfamily)